MVFNKPLQNKKRGGYNAEELKAMAPALVYLFLPAVMGFTYLWFGVLYTNSLRLVLFDFFWLAYALFIVAFASLSGAKIDRVVREAPPQVLILLAVFIALVAYTTYAVAISQGLAIRAAERGIVALVAGFAAASLKKKFFDKAPFSFGYALFGAMLLHIPFLFWLYYLEGENTEFLWNYRLPGFTGVRPYNYLVEAGIASGIGLYWLAHKKSFQHKLILWAGTTLLWAALFWSGGRGGLTALILTLILVTFACQTFRARIWVYITSTSIIGALISLQLPSPGGGFGILGGVDRTYHTDSLDQLTSGRINMWIESFDLFLQKPIFGHGLSQYSQLTQIPGFSVHIHTHNILLDSLLSFGIVGTLILVFLLGRLWVSALIRLREPESKASFPLFLVVTVLLAHGFVSGTYSHLHSQILIAMCLGLLVRAKRSEPA